MTLKTALLYLSIQILIVLVIGASAYLGYCYGEKQAAEIVVQALQHVLVNYDCIKKDEK